MKLMLHICCGPCAIYPVQILREDATEVHALQRDIERGDVATGERELRGVARVTVGDDLDLGVARVDRDRSAQGRRAHDAVANEDTCSGDIAVNRDPRDL